MGHQLVGGTLIVAVVLSGDIPIEPYCSNTAYGSGNNSQGPHRYRIFNLLFNGGITIKYHIDGSYGVVKHMSHDAGQQAACAVVEPTKHHTEEEGKGYLCGVHVYHPKNK